MTSLDDIRQSLHDDLTAAASLDALEQVRVKYMGKKGLIKDLLGRIKDLGAGERAAFAAQVNALRDEAEAALSASKESLARAAREAGFRASAVDLTLPGDRPRRGSVHPVTAAEAVLMEVMRSLGFQATYGPEVETEYFCFDALNIPKHHPARDMQDTFYLGEGIVLRTHTTSVQARTLATGRSPIKVVSLGRVYRNETVDPQHLAVFHQLEGIWIEEGLTFAHLKGLLAYLARRLYGAERGVRFKPKYYPYTEPSVGLDVSCVVCAGSGETDGAPCAACSGVGWVTVLGAGMVHRNVFQEFGYDGDRVQGIAFGLGTSRMAAQRYGIDKLRALYDNDLRVLSQF
jgi:phenylalanyl-tRNA synthetase alpha chain